MKTFYEEVMQINKNEIPKEYEPILNFLDKAEIFNIQNVADYWFSLIAGKNNTGDLFDFFPNIAPPFENIFFEYSLPEKMFFDGEYKKNPFAGMKHGFLFQSIQVDDGWKIIISSFWKINNGIKFDDLIGGISVLKNGEIKKEDGAPYLFIKVNKNLPGVDNFVFATIGCCLLALSFLHCKNVETIAQEPKRITGKRTPRNQSKIKYHVLKIEPMKKILRDEGDSETRGIKHALHICRGHFKDFSNGEGLFGKYKGMYWWNSQVRGNTKHGIVNKDYSVMSPENSNDN